MIGFTTIYSQAVSRFDDPILSKNYRESPQDFYGIMYQRMKAAIADFVMPTATAIKLNNFTEPTFYTEIFSGDGETDTFNLTDTTLDLTNANYYCIIDGTKYAVSISDYVVTLPIIPSEGVDNVVVNIYIDGQFNDDLDLAEQEILSLFLVKAWAEKERNFLLDIRRLINDKDFKLISEANSLKEKNNWYISIREEAEKKMQLLSWKTALLDRRRR